MEGFPRKPPVSQTEDGDELISVEGAPHDFWFAGWDRHPVTVVHGLLHQGIGSSLWSANLTRKPDGGFKGLLCMSRKDDLIWLIFVHWQVTTFLLRSFCYQKCSFWHPILFSCSLSNCHMMLGTGLQKSWTSLKTGSQTRYECVQPLNQSRQFRKVTFSIRRKSEVTSRKRRFKRDYRRETEVRSPTVCWWMNWQTCDLRYIPGFNMFQQCFNVYFFFGRSSVVR